MSEITEGRILLEFVLSMVGTLSFGLLFGIPRRQYLPCALTGAVGWVAYQLCVLYGIGAGMATLLAALPLTLLSRIFAITRKAPVTVFLLCGIFPLVPGAGIYYTAYYFIQNEQALFAYYGLNTIKVAAALALGISVVLGLPLPRRGRRR